MPRDAAETGRMQPLLARVGAGLDDFLRFEHPDALHPGAKLARAPRPAAAARGIGIDAVADELVRHVIPNGSSIPRPGFSSFITTGATTASALAATAAGVAAPQRYGHTAFNFLEALSLHWLAEMFGLEGMQGVYSSGGSVANLLALGAARQRAFERLGRDPAADGIDRPVAVYATTEAHHTIQRSAGVLGIGRRAVRAISVRPARPDAGRCAAPGDRRGPARRRPADGDRRQRRHHQHRRDRPAARDRRAGARKRRLVPRRRRLRPARRARRARRAALRRARARRLGHRRSAQVARRRGRRGGHLRSRPRAASPRLHPGAGALSRRQHGSGRRRPPRRSSIRWTTSACPTSTSASS